MDWTNSTEILNLLELRTVVTNLVFWLIIALLGGIWWGIIQINKRRKRKKEEKELIENLLSEIIKNQGQLYSFSVCVTKVLEQDIETSDDETFPNELNFKKDDYLLFSHRFGLLDAKSRIKIKEYYEELDDIDKRYPKLNIHETFSPNGQRLNMGIPFSNLIKLKCDKQLGKYNNIDEIEAFLRNSKKEYDLGEELIIKLKEII